MHAESPQLSTHLIAKQQHIKGSLTSGLYENTPPQHKQLAMSNPGCAGKPNTTSLLLAAGLNAAVLGYVAFKLYRSASVQHEKYLQLKASAQRLWRLATQVCEQSSAQERIAAVAGRCKAPQDI